MSSTVLDVPTLETLIAASVAAPSIHNTQPWRFRLDPDTVTLEIRAVAERGLRHTDPSGRALHVSVGCALFNLRVAVIHHGWEPVTRLLPRPEQPDLLATVRLAGATRLTAAPHLYDALWRRRQQPLPVLRPAGARLRTHRTGRGRPCGRRRAGPPRPCGDRPVAAGDAGGGTAQHRRHRPGRGEPSLGPPARRRMPRHAAGGDRPAGLPGADPHAGLQRPPTPRDAQRASFREAALHRRPVHPARPPDRLAARRGGTRTRPAGGHRPRSTGISPAPVAGVARPARATRGRTAGTRTGGAPPGLRQAGARLAAPLGGAVMGDRTQPRPPSPVGQPVEGTVVRGHGPGPRRPPNVRVAVRRDQDLSGGSCRTPLMRRW